MKRYKSKRTPVMTAVMGLILLANVSAHARDESDITHGLRTITYNVYGCNGYPAKSGKGRDIIAIAIASELSLYRPDIVSLQESPSEALVAKIAAKMGMNYVYFKGGFPGAIITRLKIVESDNCPLLQGERPKQLFTRHWGRALLDTGREKIAFYSAHLMPGLKREAIRAREVTEMLAVMKKDMNLDRSILFQGDLNHTPEGPEYRSWTNAGLFDAAAKGDPKQFTWKNFSPVKRIDYIWSYGPIASRLREYKVLADGAFVGNPDEPKPFALSDHIPVMATFK